MTRDEELFARARELSPAERTEFLVAACRGDEACRARVEALLRGHERAGDFLRAPLAASGSTVPVDRPVEMIGHYKLLEKIGEGGCGVVYVAEQQEPVQRRVALKLIKLGMDTHAVVARFEAERQALALMDHPNIAKVFDAGATESGRPYFVMELVHGIPIKSYCDQNHLTPAQRIELVITICSAIQHAHDKGIIHRDLKPSNVLVTDYGGLPVPKVIDFGIAKATQGRLTERTLITAVEQFMGTPVYMSPEQADLSGLDVDARSDIYSLGVLLYELLVGHPPFDARTFAQGGVDAIRRQIREIDPPRPSVRLRTLTEAERETIARARGTARTELSSLLRGDLDWIVMRCLEKDRTRRYSSAHELALDLQHHLRHEPVSARSPSPTYVLGRFLRRHRARVVTAAAVVAALGWGLSRELERKSDRGGTLAIKSREPKKTTKPGETPTLADKARAIYCKFDYSPDELDLAAGFARRATELAETSAYAWAVRAYTEATYIFRGWDRSRKRYDDARSFANRALGLRPDEPEALLALGWVLSEQGADRTQIEQLYRRAMAAAPDDVLPLNVLGHFLTYRPERREEGLALLKTAVRLDPRDPRAHYNLAISYSATKEYSLAWEHVEAMLANQPYPGALLLQAGLALQWKGDLGAMRAALERIGPAYRGEDRAIYLSMWCGLMERNPDRVLQAAAFGTHDYLASNTFNGPKAWLLAMAHHLAGRENLARLQWQAAEALLRQRLREEPANPTYRGQLAYTLVWLGERAEAAQLVAPIESAARERPNFPSARFLAWYYAALGDASKAAPCAQYALDSDGGQGLFARLSVNVLKLDPFWDKLRGQPEFEALFALPPNRPPRP